MHLKLTSHIHGCHRCKEKEKWKAVISVAPIVDAMNSWFSLTDETAQCLWFSTVTGLFSLYTGHQDDTPGRQRVFAWRFRFHSFLTIFI
jgi:hypothetical protein